VWLGAAPTMTRPRIITAAVVAVVLILLVAGRAAREPELRPTAQAQHRAVRTAISAAWRDHIAAAQRKDADAVMRLYDDDISYSIPGSIEHHGRAAVDSMERAGLAAADVISATHTTHQLEQFGDRTYEIGTVEGPVQPQGGEAKRVTFHYMALWQRQADGSWRIRHLVGGS
jgi:uncharacterized protein (TIGR02246 family)